jgi:peptide/nickel transport system substrate-binding protein
VILIVISGLGGYFAGVSTVPPGGEKTITLTETVTASPYKDTVIMGTTDSVQSSIDPSDAYDFFGWTVIQNTGSPLIDITPGSPAGPKDLAPALAESWSVSSDGLTWTFNLRKGVMSGDGVEFTADDVKYSFERGMKIANPDGAVVGIGYDAIIGSVEAVSKYQVNFNLKFACGFFGQLMAAAPSYIVNPRYAPMQYFRINYTDGNARASSPMDLGPYTLTSWTRVGGKDQEMKFDANPLYWNAAAGYPKTKHLVLRFYSDATTLRLAIEAGEVDLAYRQLGSTDIQSLQQKAQLKVWQGPSQFIQYLVFQQNIKPLDNPAVRRAIAASIDRKPITDVVFLGQATPLYSMIPNGMAYHSDVFKKLGDANYTYAKTELAALGYSETKKLVLDLWYESSGHYESSPDIANVLKSSLEKSGVIQVNLHGVDWPTYRNNMRAESMALFVLGWYPDYVDPDNYLYPFVNSKASWLHSNYNSPLMDSMTEEQRATADPQKRTQLMASIQDLLVEDSPIVPLFQKSNWAVSKQNVGGVVLDISMIFRYYLLFATK